MKIRMGDDMPKVTDLDVARGFHLIQLARDRKLTGTEFAHLAAGAQAIHYFMRDRFGYTSTKQLTRPVLHLWALEASAADIRGANDFLAHLQDRGFTDADGYVIAPCVPS